MVDLEKIASMLEDAYETISGLEEKNEKLSSKNEELEHELSLSKEASVAETFWDSTEMGGPADEMPTNRETPESKLDAFLLD